MAAAAPLQAPRRTVHPSCDRKRRHAAQEEEEGRPGGGGALGGRERARAIVGGRGRARVAAGRCGGVGGAAARKLDGQEDRGFVEGRQEGGPRSHPPCVCRAQERSHPLPARGVWVPPAVRRLRLHPQRSISVDDRGRHPGGKQWRGRGPPSHPRVHTHAVYRGDTSFAPNPVLQVLSRKTAYRQPAYRAGSFGKGRKTVPMQHTQLRVRDGEDNQLMLNLAMHLTGESRKLKGGDVIRLEMYTPLTYQVDEGDRERRPFVFVTKYSVVGYDTFPDDPNALPAPLSCRAPGPPPRGARGAGPAGTEVQPCPDGDCKCSTEEIGMDRCICKSNPVDRINLQTLKEDCYFANKEVANMSLSEKRCMLYWWYATDIYGICGKGKRLQLPDCLVCAVRRRFPEPDGNYTGYEEYLDSV